jgi:hypothetical protein
MTSSKTLLAVLTVAAMLAIPAATAQATIIISVTELGGDVVFSSTGSLDITGAEYLGGIGYADGFIPGGSNWYIASGAGTFVDNYAMTSYAGPFGTSETFFSWPTSVYGDDFFIWGQAGLTAQVGVPVGYVSFAPISSGMVFSGVTIASLSLTPGTYVYTIPNDEIILRIGSASPVPDPGSSLLLFGIGLVGVRAWRKRLG